MLNTTNNFRLGSNTQTVSFNSPSTGILQRSHPKSTFIRFRLGDNVEKHLFPKDGKNSHIYKYSQWTNDGESDKYNEYEETKGRVEVFVLQVLIFGDNNYLAEVVETKYLVEE